MLAATQLKNNTCFLYKNEPYKVLQYKHTHLSRRGADIKVRVKNLKTGSILNLNFGSNDRFPKAEIEKKKMQYLYEDGTGFYFMNPQTYEQLQIETKLIGGSARFLKQGDLIDILFWQDNPFDLDLPLTMVLTISQCDPGVKGNSATNIYKPAVADNGLKFKVPLFINPGDKVKVDTRTGKYVERAKPA